MSDNKCPKCENNALMVEVYDDGSGKVRCNQEGCEFEDKFSPIEQMRNMREKNADIYRRMGEVG